MNKPQGIKSEIALRREQIVKLPLSKATKFNAIIEMLSMTVGRKKLLTLKEARKLTRKLFNE